MTQSVDESASTMSRDDSVKVVVAAHRQANLLHALDRALDLLSQQGQDIADTCAFVELEALRETVERPESDTLLPSQSGAGEYCAPGPAESQAPVWLLRFEDIDKPDQYLFDEAAARKAFARTESLGWNCYLFEQAKRIADVEEIGGRSINE